MVFNSFIMKKLLFISFLFISLSSYTQGNLQFNRVVNLNYTGSTSGGGSTTFGTVTIPDGKVWKITYAYCAAATDNNLPYLSQNLDFHLRIGNIFVHTSTSQVDPGYNRGIIWISSGSKNIDVIYPVVNSKFNVSITAIEFNIIQ